MLQLSCNPQLVKSDAFHLGQEFAKHYPSSVADMIAYQKLHERNDSGEMCSDINLFDTQCNNLNSATSERHGISGTGSDTKRAIGGIDVSTNTVHKGKVTNVRRNSSQAKQNDVKVNPSGNPTNSIQSDFSSYLRFSQWKGTFNDTRSFTSWIEYLHLPTQVPFTRKRDMSDEALDFMRGAMDECTHLGNFCTPTDTSLIIIVAAKHDAYVPRGTTLNLQQLWPGSEVRYVNTGHIAAFLTKQHIFRLVTQRIKRHLSYIYS